MVRVLQRVAGLDAEQRLVCARVLVQEVVDVAGGDERQPGRLGELRELRVDPLLRLEPGVLDLDVGRVAAEDLDEPVEVAGGVLRPVLLERLRDAAREAAGEHDEPLRVPLEQLPVDPRLVVVALQVAERGELDQVRVALVRLGEDGQVRVALLLPAAVVGDVDLAADDRLDPLLARLAVELDRAGQRAVVGERDGRHPELGGPRGERRGSGTPRPGSSTPSGREDGRRAPRTPEGHRTTGVGAHLRSVLREQHAALAGAVVVLHLGLDLEAERRWNATDAVFTGEVTQWTLVRPWARAAAKKRSYSSRARPALRCAGATPTKWT